MQNKSVKDIKEIVDNLSVDQYLEYIDILKSDERKSVQKMAVSLAKKLDAIRKEEQRLELINTYEKEAYSKGYLYIGGIDEVGRGPLAGPVVAAVVVLPYNTKIEGIHGYEKGFKFYEKATRLFISGCCYYPWRGYKTKSYYKRRF